MSGASLFYGKTAPKIRGNSISRHGIPSMPAWHPMTEDVQRRPNPLALGLDSITSGKSGHATAESV